MEEKNEVIIVSEEMLQDKIYNIRGFKVMLDFELAEIYGYTTTKFNQQEKIILRNLMTILCFN